MKTQSQCPVNQKTFKNIRRLESVSEKEIKMILEGRSDDASLDSLCRKLKMFYPQNTKEFFPVIHRNLKFLLDAS